MAPPVSVHPENLPRRFGRYVLFDKIGEGGMARIYLGRPESGSDKLLVVKQMLPLFSNSERFSKLLIDEAKLAAELTNSNIVQVFDLGREGDVLYIAMEYVEGFDLRQLLQQCSKRQIALPIEFSLFVVGETLKALEHAHKKKNEQGESLGIVHRDVSPSNVLLSFHGEVKLCDFGIARAMAAREEVPDEAIEGKAGYMSPEAARGEPIDARADVFSVGIVLWELVAGRKLYRGGGVGRMPSLEQASQAEIPVLPERGLPHETELHRIIGRALSVDRDMRYASCRDMRRDLEAYVLEAGLTVSQLKFGEWITQNFGTEIIELRRERERAARAWLSERPPAPVAVKPSEPKVATAVPSERRIEAKPGQAGRSEAPLPGTPAGTTAGGGSPVVAVLGVLLLALIAAFWLLR